MPELPEVETIRRQLNKKIVGKILDSKKIINVRRRAKILIIDFSDNSSLLFHLKLTGQLIFNGEKGPYTRQIFNFKDGSKLIFNDVRKFGWWKYVKNTKDIEKAFGPEAPEMSLGDFKAILKKRPNAKIKALLMDQKAVAGIGNIYSDEILFAAKVKPLRRVKTLKSEEIEAIWLNTGKILKAAIKNRGTSERDYVDASGQKGEYLKYLKVYRKEGQKCSRCASLIKRIKMGSRSAHFCSKCQK
jgi:formamidopyrimidine-DNA glycosylase